MSTVMHAPVYFTFGLHAHQPVGNFGHVFEEHLRDVYQPFLTRAIEGELFPLTLHLSGPLLEWLEANNPGYLDLVGRLAAEGKLELLLAGYYEPILPSLLREDRIEQIHWMQEALRARFGIGASGLWLTERVWEPDLAADLADAGVGYVLVDDRHFVAAGFAREDLHQPFRTESGGRSIGVFAIDETLRYLLPFHPPEDTVAYLRDLGASGRRLAVAADDIEKFGGWPGTHEWVYERGWIEDFIRAMKALEEEGGVRMATFSQALAELPSGGLAYLPSSSYREMEEWALPTEAFQRLDEMRAVIGEERLAKGDSPLIRGSHWRNFLVKYPESNRMHKKTLALSKLCRERGSPQAARRALGAAQCNDVYWHGVFGGLYLRHLRDTVWRKIAEAEGRLREGEGLAWEQLDLDLDGNDELWIHSAAFSALLSPARGGSLEELTLFDQGVNLANTLTRRREAYHQQPGDGDGLETSVESAPGGHDADTTPSIHDLENPLGFTELPPTDREDRALFQERVLPGGLGLDAFRRITYEPLHSWAAEELQVRAVEEGVDADAGSGWIEVSLGSESDDSFEKSLRFTQEGAVEVFFTWDPARFPEDSFFSTELSLGAEARVQTVPESTPWRFPICTFSKSEKGFDETIQGESLTIRWPIRTGWGRVRLTRG
jgi:alpha-amylase